MAETTSPISSKPDKPYWLPDTQGFLAIAIIAVVAGLAFILLLGTVKFDDKVAGAFMTLLGVLMGSLKDVYSFYFGSSRSSDKKDDALITQAAAATGTIPPASFSPPLSMKNGTTIKTVADALSFVSQQNPTTSDSMTARDDVMKILANGGTDAEKSAAFTKWAAGQGLI